MGILKVGDKFTNKKGLEFVVVEYKSARSVRVRFESGFETDDQASNIRRGNVKDLLHPNVCGVGFMGAGKHKSSVGNKDTVPYKHWINMMKRCYSEKMQLDAITYVGCSVSEIWHNFQNFADWYEENGILGYQLDKDIIEHGNKEYHPDRCIMVHKDTNAIFNKPKKTNGLPLGISHSNSVISPYVAHCWVDGVHESKYSNDIDELSEWYKVMKTYSVTTHSKKYYPNDKRMLSLLTNKVERFLM